jgi:hypothetical protein
MLRIGSAAVKPLVGSNPLCGGEICPQRAPTADCAPDPRARIFLTLTFTLLTFAAVAGALALLVRRRRSAERHRALGQLLDAADGLEARLRTARAEIEAITGSEDGPVREALQEMLRQRLWLHQHGAGASLEQLHTVRASIEVARLRIDQQLLQIERARALLH